jgi:hypothetical protein
MIRFCKGIEHQTLLALSPPVQNLSIGVDSPPLSPAVGDHTARVPNEQETLEASRDRPESFASVAMELELEHIAIK